MDFENIDRIAEQGFDGFVAISSLQASMCRDVPAEQGVYLVVRLDSTPPVFLGTSVGGHFKGKDPTAPVVALHDRWVEGPIVVYIGKAGGPTGQATLKSRLISYMQFGLGKPTGHWGGRYIWQLASSGDLRVCWKPTPRESPAAMESRLIQEFKAKYGKRPFANLRD